MATTRELGCCHWAKWHFLYGVTRVRCYWPLHHLWQKSLAFNCLFKTSTREERRSERMWSQSHTECNILILWCTHYCPQRELPGAEKLKAITELCAVLPVIIMLCTGREPASKMPVSSHTPRLWPCCCPWSNIISPTPFQHRDLNGEKDKDTCTRLSC